jgi:acyl-CoA hydrolase
LRKVELIHIHTFSDGLIDLVKSGVVTGEDKKVLQNLIAASYAMLSNKLYEFIDANRMVVVKDAAYTNDTAIIRYNPKVVAINSAIEIDITGQVCADSIGTMQHYGF